MEGLREVQCGCVLLQWLPTRASAAPGCAERFSPIERAEGRVQALGHIGSAETAPGDVP